MLKNMDVFTVERNPTSVMFVKRSLLTKAALTDIKSCMIRVLKATNVKFAARNM